MPRRVAIAVLAAPTWSPPGVDPDAWRVALAEDVLDVLGTLAGAEAAAAVQAREAELLRQVGWPGLRAYRLQSLDIVSVLRAAADDGFDEAVLLAADAPDLPGMLIAKLLQPLASKPVAAAPALGADRGLLGLAAKLPAPDWLPHAGLDDLTPQSLRRLAPASPDVAPAPGWRRLRSPADLASMDPHREGWDATRLLLTPRSAS